MPVRPRSGGAFVISEGPLPSGAASIGPATLLARRAPSPACSSSVDISSVIHPKHGDRALLLVDAIQDAKRAASGTVDAGEFVAEFTANSSRVVEKRPGDEVDHRGSDTFRQLLADRSGGRTRDYQVVANQRQRCLGGRSARTASTPRTTSPAAIAVSAARSARIASVSPSTEIVSSRLARSSVLMRTIAGRPLRVTTTRSCSFSTRSTYSEKRSLTVRSASVLMATIVPRVVAPGNPPSRTPICSLVVAPSATVVA